MNMASEQRERAEVNPEGLREWLLQLEKRVSELERTALRRSDLRRRYLFTLLIGLLVYLALWYVLERAMGV